MTDDILRLKLDNTTSMFLHTYCERSEQSFSKAQKSQTNKDKFRIRKDSQR